jgi:hypothetical protein
LAYQAARWPVNSGVWFDSIDDLPHNGRKRRLLIRSALTEAVQLLAEQNYVCLLIPEAHEIENENTAILAEEQPSQRAVQATGATDQA